MRYCKLFELALTITIAGLSACSDSKEDNVITKSEIKLTSEIIPTSHATSSDYQPTQIPEGQQVGVTLFGAQSEHKNTPWIAGTNGELKNTSHTAYWGNTTLTITAYQPYNSTWTETDQIFSVSTDQSTNAGYSNSDLLWVSTTVPKADTPINLKFAHKLVLINITLSSDEIEDFSDTQIYICNTNISTGFNPASGTLFEAEENIADIKANITKSSVYTASAIIVPQIVARDTKFIKITRNDKDFYYTLLENKHYRSGYSYHYTLRVNDSNMENPVEGKEIEW